MTVSRHDEWAAVAERFGVAMEQVRRDHLISHVLAAISAAWRPALRAASGSQPSTVGVPGVASVQVQLLGGAGYQWPTEVRAIEQRYSDAPPARLRTRSSCGMVRRANHRSPGCSRTLLTRAYGETRSVTRPACRSLPRSHSTSFETRGSPSGRPSHACCSLTCAPRSRRAGTPGSSRRRSTCRAGSSPPSRPSRRRRVPRARGT